jgi:hypothetical protein
MKMISQSFQELISSINHEFREVEKFQNGSGTVFVTRQFIIKLEKYQTYICRISESTLKTEKVTEIHVPGTDVPDQNATILVTAGKTSFRIFIKASELQDFKRFIRVELEDLEDFQVKDLWTAFIGGFSSYH